MENISTWNYYEPDFLPASRSAACVLSVLCGHNVCRVSSHSMGNSKNSFGSFFPCGRWLVMVEAETAGIKTPWSGASWCGARAATSDQLITRAKWPSPATPAPTARDQLLHLLQRGEA